MGVLVRTEDNWKQQLDEVVALASILDKDFALTAGPDVTGDIEQDILALTFANPCSEQLQCTATVRVAVPAGGLVIKVGLQLKEHVCLKQSCSCQCLVPVQPVCWHPVIPDTLAFYMMPTTPTLCCKFCRMELQIATKIQAGWCSTYLQSCYSCAYPQLTHLSNLQNCT